jgi:hypothetical protein
MYTYDIKNILGTESHYVPILLNVLVNSEKQSGLKSNYISSKNISLVASAIDKIEAVEFFLDFSGIVIGEGGFDVFLDMIKAQKKTIIFYNLPDIVFSFIKDDCKENLEYDSEQKLISTQKGIDIFNSNKEKVKNLPNNIIRSFIHQTTINKEIHFSSSNVTGNKYIDIKKIFNEPSLFQLVICELGKYINEKVKNGQLKFDKILCVSQNGAALASALGVFLEKDIEYLKTIRGIVPNTKYIFIADMVCLGTEYKIAKTIIKLADSKLIDGLTVAKYLDYDSKHTLFTLCEINDGDEFGYKITVEKKA